MPDAGGLLAAGTAWGEWGPEEISSVVTGVKALGFVPDGMKNGFSIKGIMPDYTVAGLPDAAAYILSAIAGVALLIILFKVAGSFRKDKEGGTLG